MRATRSDKGLIRKPAMSSEEAVTRHLKFNRAGKTKRFTATIAGIYELGGADGVVQWAYKRIDNSIGSPAELTQLRMLLKASAYAEARRDRQLNREWEQAAKRRDYEQLWVGLLRDRDLQERAKARKDFDPRRLVQERLERMKQQMRQPAGVMA